MTQGEAWEAAGVAMDLALELEAGLDPDVELSDAHVEFLATTVLEAVGLLHGVAAFVATLIEDGAPAELVGLRERLRSVSGGEEEQRSEGEVVAELGHGWRIERMLTADGCVRYDAGAVDHEGHEDGERHERGGRGWVPDAGMALFG